VNRQQVKAVIERVAREVIEVGGPSFAQEQIVLRKVADEMRVRGRLDDEQFILTCWNELFRDGVLSWGYNMENPSRPWFHFSHA
jgi:hypothetical protein